MAGAMNPKRMSLDTLLGNADQIAAEIQRRVEMLNDAQKKLGVVGLRLQVSSSTRTDRGAFDTSGRILDTTNGSGRFEWGR